MACPRFCGVTNWMSSIANMSLATARDNPVLKAIENATGIFDNADKTTNRLEEIVALAGTNSTNEVNHRPAAQQWAVCTP